LGWEQIGRILDGEEETQDEQLSLLEEEPAAKTPVWADVNLRSIHCYAGNDLSSKKKLKRSVSSGMNGRTARRCSEAVGGRVFLVFVNPAINCWAATV